MADSIVSIADYSGATGGANSGGKSFKMAVFGIRTDVIPKLKGDGWNKYPISPDADCTSVCNKIAHKTYPEIEKICQQDTRIVPGSTGDEMGDAVVAALGGKTSEEKGSGASTIKEAIKEVMSAWDGEVEAYVRDMKMYIHKIKLPEQDCNLVLSEGLNIASDSVNIKDYCPNNTNKLVVHWNGGDDIILQDSTRIERFGEKVKEMDAVKRVLASGDDAKSALKNSKNTTSTTTSEDTDTETSSSSSSDKGYEEVPAETYEEALEFARLEWNKCKREDCHEIELTTVGSPEWQQGLWVRVYIPSFDIDGYYYISRVSEDMSPDEYNVNMTLVDYPPSFGEPEEETEEEEESEDEEETTVGDT